MPDIRATVDSARATLKLRAVVGELDARATLGTIGQRILGWTGLNIQGAGTDEPWQIMAEVTRLRRPQRPSPRHFSSRYQSLLQQSPVSVLLGETAVRVAVTAKYAEYHHHGAQRGRWRLPARKLIPKAERARDLAIEVLRAIGAAVRVKGNG